MFRERYIKEQKIVFSQWSGKNYAVFASLGKVVKIGVLAIDICMQSIKKSSSIINSICDTGDFKDFLSDEFGEASIDIISFLFGDFILQPVILCSNSDSSAFDNLLNIKKY